MTPAQAKAAMLAAPLNLLNGITVLDVTGLDENRVQLTVSLQGLGQFVAEVPIPAPLPLSAGELLELVVAAQSRIGAATAKFATDFGRGFNDEGRGALVSSGYRADGGWV